MDPATFSLLMKMNENIAALTERMATLEARRPLASAFEQGGGSAQPQPRPLPDQRAAFEAATMGPQRAATPPPNPPAPRGHRNGYNPIPNSPLPRVVVPPFVDDRFEEEEQAMTEDEWVQPPQRAYQRRYREPEQDGIGKIKVKIPVFDGKCDPDAYMMWETKIEQIWSCHNFPEHKKVQLAALEFHEFALIWWDKLVRERRLALDPPVATWEK